jgi:hypothetical protein
MPHEKIPIETTGDLQFLGAAKYLSVLAYPNNMKWRMDFIYASKAALCKSIAGELKDRLLTDENILKFSEQRAGQPPIWSPVAIGMFPAAFMAEATGAIA